MLVDDCVEKTGRLSVKKIVPKFVGVLSRFIHRLLHTAGSLSRFYELQNYAKRIKFSKFFEFHWK